MSGQIVTYILEPGQRLLLCTARNANRAASFASAQVNRYQCGLTSTLQCLLNGVCKKVLLENECVQSQDEANLIPISSCCSSRNSRTFSHFISA